MSRQSGMRSVKVSGSNGTVMFFSYLAHIFARRTTVFLLGLVER